MLDELGPTFVKFGQLLSTRPDIVPPDIIAELRALQDDVRPFPFADVERTIGEELGQPIERLFLSSTRSRSPPRRSARCIARRCRTAGRSSSRCSGRTRRARSRPTSRCSTRRRGSRRSASARSTSSTPNELVDEFARSIRQELDYRLEARNADAFHRNFAGHPHVVDSEGVLVVHARARAHARGARRRAARRPRRSSSGRSSSAASSRT